MHIYDILRRDWTCTIPEQVANPFATNLTTRARAVSDTDDIYIYIYIYCYMYVCIYIYIYL